MSTLSGFFAGFDPTAFFASPHVQGMIGLATLLVTCGIVHFVARRWVVPLIQQVVRRSEIR